VFVFVFVFVFVRVFVFVFVRVFVRVRVRVFRERNQHTALTDTPTHAGPRPARCFTSAHFVLPRCRFGP
jgi:hypothetical protein